MKYVGHIYFLGTGIIYRNPAPHVVSRQAYFPSVAELGDGRLAAAFVIGQAFESVDSDTWFALSGDGGQTWSKPEPMIPAGKARALSSNCARITGLGDGRLAAMMVRSDRSRHPDEGLANPENMGFVPSELLLLRWDGAGGVSEGGFGGGRWSEPVVVTPPVESPAFEACSPIVVLGDGRWVWPTSTWRGWKGDGPGGMRMVALVSVDEGKHWREHLEVMDGRKEKIIFWESKIVELADGRLLAAAWTYDEAKGVDLPIHYTISADGGSSWSAPASTGITGQTVVLAVVDGRIVSVYRRVDQPGLWLTVSRVAGDAWVNDADSCLWGGKAGSAEKPQNMVHEFNNLKFGAPSLLPLADGTLFVSFWCYEDMVSNIRWIKVKI